MKQEITIYTDGSSLGNPGAGGWGVIFLANKKVLELGGSAKEVTNNQMELTAMREAFKTLASKNVVGHTIKVYSDSKYVLGGLTEWLVGWKKKGWKKSDGKQVLNQDLWQELDQLQTYLQEENTLVYEHVKAHVGHKYNERVDDIARFSAELNEELQLFSGKFDEYLS